LTAPYAPPYPPRLALRPPPPLGLTACVGAAQPNKAVYSNNPTGTRIEIIKLPPRHVSLKSHARPPMPAQTIDAQTIATTPTPHGNLRAKPHNTKAQLPAIMHGGRGIMHGGRDIPPPKIAGTHLIPVTPA
jgi:hypothetical protein